MLHLETQNSQPPGPGSAAQTPRRLQPGVLKAGPGARECAEQLGPGGVPSSPATLGAEHRGPGALPASLTSGLRGQNT